MQPEFNQFNLSPAIKQGLAALGFKTPTPIQEHAIPIVLSGRDAILQAKTGSGKTLAFGLPIMSMLKPKSKPQALVVLPTRELAIQVRDALASVSGDSPLRTLAVYGGVGLGPQEKALHDGIDLVIGTPGRLKDLITRGSLDLSRAHLLVLDEADEMLDMGFRRDIEFLLGKLTSRKQTLILSATMPEAIKAIAHQYLKDPAVVGLVQKDVTPDEISHHFVRVKTERRLDALMTLIRTESPERAIIFTRMKHETKRLAQKLERIMGCEFGFLNGNMSQNARNRMMDRFRSGEITYLIATDVAARGIDIEGLTHVFHYAVPNVVEAYIHRSGRTGRAGKEGKTICLVTPDDADAFKAILKRVPAQEIRLELPESDETSETEADAPRREAPRGRQAASEDWKKFKLSLPKLRDTSEEGLRHWLVQRTGLAPAAFRAITLHADHAIIEVSARSSERFKQAIQRPQTQGTRPQGARSQGHRPDGHRPEGHRSEGHRAEGQRSDAHRTETHRAEPQRSESRGARNRGNRPQGRR
ncbi:DEAD-box ATP-dependent RNA helicase CshA [compost metagenome]